MGRVDDRPVAKFLCVSMGGPREEAIRQQFDELNVSDRKFNELFPRGVFLDGFAPGGQLSKAGHEVQIIHAGGTDATSAAFGWINASFFLNDDHHHLRAQGIAAWHRALKDVAAPVMWQGCLCWDMPPEEMEATFQQLRARDYPVEMLSKVQVQKREPALTDAPEQALFLSSASARPIEPWFP